MSKQIFQKFDVEFRKKVFVPTPEGDDEAVNKAYVDSLVSVSSSKIRSENVISAGAEFGYTNGAGKLFFDVNPGIF